MDTARKPKCCPTCGRPFRLEKTAEQRNKFHALCREIGNHVGLTEGQVKAMVKQEQFGLDEFKFGGKWYRTVMSSEEADRLNYSDLIETAYRMAAEAEVAIES